MIAQCRLVLPTNQAQASQHFALLVTNMNKRSLCWLIQCTNNAKIIFCLFPRPFMYVCFHYLDGFDNFVVLILKQWLQVIVSFSHQPDLNQFIYKFSKMNSVYSINLIQ